MLKLYLIYHHFAKPCIYIYMYIYGFISKFAHKCGLIYLSVKTNIYALPLRFEINVSINNLKIINICMQGF